MTLFVFKTAGRVVATKPTRRKSPRWTDAAREEKNAMEHQYSDSLKDIEMTKKQCDEVKKSCEVT